LHFVAIPALTPTGERFHRLLHLAEQADGVRAGVTGGSDELVQNARLPRSAGGAVPARERPVELAAGVNADHRPHSPLAAPKQDVRRVRLVVRQWFGQSKIFREAARMSSPVQAGAGAGWLPSASALTAVSWISPRGPRCQAAMRAS